MSFAVFSLPALSGSPMSKYGKHKRFRANLETTLLGAESLEVLATCQVEAKRKSQGGGTSMFKGGKVRELIILGIQTEGSSKQRVMLLFFKQTIDPVVPKTILSNIDLLDARIYNENCGQPLYTDQIFIRPQNKRPNTFIIGPKDMMGKDDHRLKSWQVTLGATTKPHEILYLYSEALFCSRYRGSPN